MNHQEDPRVRFVKKSLRYLKISQLKEILSNYSVPVSGPKKELENRIIRLVETFVDSKSDFWNDFSQVLKLCISQIGEYSEIKKDVDKDEEIDHLKGQIDPQIFRVIDRFKLPISVLFSSEEPEIISSFFILPSLGKPIDLKLPPVVSPCTYVFQIIVPSNIKKTDLTFREFQFSFNDMILSMNPSKKWMILPTQRSQIEYSLTPLSVDPFIPIIAAVKIVRIISTKELTEIIIKTHPLAEKIDFITPHPKYICPLTRKVMIHPARGTKCSHGECFDLSGFLAFSIKNNNWNCPICHQNILPDELVIDPFFFSQIGEFYAV